MEVGDRERVAVLPVAGAELALEVCRLQVVRRMRRRGDDAGMGRVVAAAARLHEAPALEQVARGAHGGPVNPRVPRPQPVEQLLQAPVARLPARRAEEFGDGVVDAVRAVVRGPAPVAQSSAIENPPARCGRR